MKKAPWLQNAHQQRTLVLQSEAVWRKPNGSFDQEKKYQFDVFVYNLELLCLDLKANFGKLEELDLSNCGLGDEALKPIIKILETNYTLKTFKAKGNLFTFETLQLFTSKLQNNFGLISIELLDLKTDPRLGDLQKKIDDVIDWNKKLKQVVGFASSLDWSRPLSHEAFGKFFNYISTTNITKLYLFDLEQSLPDEVGVLSKLEELHIINCSEINILPESIQNLKNLTSLKISQLRSTVGSKKKTISFTIPKEIGSLSRLTSLFFENVNVTSIPKEIQELRNLTDLTFLNCGLYSLPPEIAKLDKLTNVNLHDNGLSMLPDEFAKLVNLRRFDVSNNQLRYLTPGVSMWTALEDLNISNNFLEDVPLSLACLPKLKTIAAKNNPFRTYPSEANLVLKLQAAYKETRSIPICKYLVMGESRSGKTTLVNNLVNFMHSQRGRKTRTAKRGFDLVEVTAIEIPDKEIVEFSIWDFQYKALTMAPMLMTKRSVFLLCINISPQTMQNELSKIEFLIKTIDSTIPQAPIYLVCTHCDIKACDKKYLTNALQEINQRISSKYRSIQQIVTVGKDLELNKKNPINELVRGTLFACYSNSLTSVLGLQKQYPAKYLALADKAMGLRMSLPIPVLTFEQWTALAFSIGFNNEPEVQEATYFLRDLGALFVHESNLSIVILDVVWLCRFYENLVAKRSGTKAITLYQNISALDTDVPNLLEELVILLENQNIIYSIDSPSSTVQKALGIQCDDRGFLLLPGHGLLPPVAPPLAKMQEHFPERVAGMIDSERCYVFEQHPKDIGVIYKIIAHFIRLDWSPHVLWRYGAILENPDNGARISIEFDRDRIVTIKFKTPMEDPTVMSSICQSIAEQIDLKHEMTVRCMNCMIDRGMNTKNFTVDAFEWALSQSGEKTIRCNMSHKVYLVHLVPDLLEKKGLLEEEMKNIKEINDRAVPAQPRTVQEVTQQRRESQSSASESPRKFSTSPQPTPSPPRAIAGGALKKELEKASASNTPSPVGTPTNGTPTSGSPKVVAFVRAKPRMSTPLSQSVEVSPVGSPVLNTNAPEVGSLPNNKVKPAFGLRSSGSNDSLMMTRSDYAPSNRTSRDSVSSQQMFLFSNTNSTKSVSKDSLMSDSTTNTNVTHKTSISKNNSGNSLNNNNNNNNYSRPVQPAGQQQTGSTTTTTENTTAAAGTTGIRITTPIRPNNSTASTPYGSPASSGSGKWVSYRPSPTNSSQ